MVFLEYENVRLPIVDEYSITKSSQDISFSDIKCDFSNHTKDDLPDKYEEVKIFDDSENKTLFFGYIDSYNFDEMREKDIDTFINFTLLTPKKISTLRTCIAVGTYQLIDLIQNTILTPLLDDGFEIADLDIADRQVTVNFLCQTVEYCLNNLSNKFDIWWYIDENKKIYIKDISLMYDKKPDFVYDNQNRISGLQYIKPSVVSDNYANVINFTNVRIYEQSELEFNGSQIINQYNPLIDKQIVSIENGNQIDFISPVDFNNKNIVKSLQSFDDNRTIAYALYIKGKYSDNQVFELYYGYDLENNKEIKTSNFDFDGDTQQSNKEFLLIKDSFFSNLITGFKYNGDKTLKEITVIKSDSALIWNINRFYNDKGISEKRDKISKTGIVELTVDMQESWKTIQELTDIAKTYLDKNGLKFDGEIELKLDKDIFAVGNTLYINKLMFEGTYIATEIQINFIDNIFEYTVKCKNTNMLSNFIDIFRAEDTQTSNDKVYNIYVTHYNAEEIVESHKVVQ